MNASVALTPELLTQLTAIVGENRIKTDADSLENWGRDHTKHFDPNPSVIVFPSSTEQVQSIVKLANQFNVEEIRKIIGADTLGFLSIDALEKSVNSKKGDYCKACFTGNYPMPVQLDFDKFHLEKIKQK